MLWRTAVGIVAVTAFSVVGVGCFGDNDGASNESDFTGSLVTANACAVKDAYAAATIVDFTHVDHADVPQAIVNQAPQGAKIAYGYFYVRNVGSVWLAATVDETRFFDKTGGAIVTMKGDAWSLSTTTPLRCASQIDGGYPTYDGGYSADGGYPTYDASPDPVADASTD